MFAVIDVLVTNRFVVCCDTYILIVDTKQYDNIQNKTAKKSRLFGSIEKSMIFEQQKKSMIFEQQLCTIES